MVTCYTPSLDTFSEQWEQGRPCVLSTRLVADLETPVSALLKLGAERPFTFLLESVEGGAVRGRYSIIGLNPDQIWRWDGAKSFLNRRALEDPFGGFEPCDGDPLDAFRLFLKTSTFSMPEELPPMSAGLFGYMGYGAVSWMETKVPCSEKPRLPVPESVFLRPTVMVIFDSVKSEFSVVTPLYPEAFESAREAYLTGSQRLEAVLESLKRSLPTLSFSPSETSDAIEMRSNVTPEAYADMVNTAKRYIQAGDIFQVVLSQRFEADFSYSPFSLYRALRRLNPSPFLYYLNMGDFSIVGSSPEILVRVREGKVTIRPIAGTRPRGKTPAEDRAFSEDLLSDPKECSEHLMLLDLGRNDVGRVARVGSVRVTERFSLEFYSQVMHIVSNVEGVLEEKRYDVIDALAAGFPAGTVSGAPKVRAMEIIAELEPDHRGLYAGCVGYFSANGEMDTCIVLRTALVRDGKIFVQAGAGIVAESDPAQEYQECLNKAKALFKAAADAVYFVEGGAS